MKKKVILIIYLILLFLLSGIANAQDWPCWRGPDGDGMEVKVWDQRRMNVAFQSWIAHEGYVYGTTWDKKRHHFQCFDLKAGNSINCSTNYFRMFLV